MISSLLRVLAGTLLVAGLIVGLSLVSLEAAGAQNVKQSACQGSGGTWAAKPTSADPGDGVCTTSGQTRTVTSTIQQVGNILIFIVGAISVIMVIIGGLRYSVAQGDQNAISSAKNTVMYALVGVVLSFAAYALVNFVVVGLNQ